MLKGRGIIRAQNVMLSAPGSINQPVHTDSQWGNRRKNPKPHYLTVLIALTDQDLLTGGTKVYPGSHRDSRLAPRFEGGTVVGVEEPQSKGTAIVFDGLLLHHGTANVTNTAQKAMQALDNELTKMEQGSGGGGASYEPTAELDDFDYGRYGMPPQQQEDPTLTKYSLQPPLGCVPLLLASGLSSSWPWSWSWF